MLKICYIKSGDVVNELQAVKNSKGEITGGPNYYIYSTLTELRNEADLLYLSLAKAEKELKEPACRAKTISIVTKSGVLKYAYLLFSITKIVKELLSYRPDHIICVTRPWLFAIYATAKFVGAGFTVSVHTDLQSKKWFNRTLTNPFISLADSVICHGPYLYDQLKALMRNTGKIVEYNASCQDIVQHKQPSSLFFRKIINKQVIVFVGRMEIVKGIYDLYDACQPLLRNDKYLHLCFAGDGSECEGIASRAKKDELTSQITILGAIERFQVADLLSQAWVAVMPTQKKFPEGRCMAAMEALALGVPVVVPNMGPFPYLVQHGNNGLLYEPDSVTSLREQLRILQNPEMRNKIARGVASGNANLISTDFSYGKAVRQCFSEARKKYL